MYSVGVPVLGICYGAQLIARQLGGIVDGGGRGEYGRAELTLASDGPAPSVLFDAVPPTFDVWMSHFDAITAAPAGFRVTASTPDAPVAALEAPARGIYGVQFHPEVGHTHGGQEILKAFLFDVAGAGRRGR